MNVKKFTQCIKGFLLRLRLRLAGDGWHVTLVRKPSGIEVHLKCKECELLTYSVNTLDEIAWVLRTVFPGYGIDPYVHKRVITALNKRYVAITRKTISAQAQKGA